MSFQDEALDLVRQKYNVLAVASLPDGRMQVEVGNGPTPYIFVSKEGEVEDEDGYAIDL